MADIKDSAGTHAVAEFIATVTHPVCRADAETLIPIMEGVSGASPTMWCPSIIGLGSYHYK